MKMSTMLYFSFLIALYYSCFSQEEQLQFNLLGQEDDLSLLRDKKQLSLYENLKWTDLGSQNFFSFGGSYRLQVENFVNQNFSSQMKEDNIWYLNRILLHSHVKISNQFELYTELSSSTIINKNDPTPVDKDVLAVNQAFVKYHFASDWTLLIGRENLKFGGRRLVDIREGPNVRRSFDLIRLNYDTENATVNTFFSIPVQPLPHAFDNNIMNFSETFSGIYASQSFNSSFNLDLYGLYQKDDNANYNSGMANERRYTMGTRVFGTVKSFTYNHEVVYQFGHFGNQTINAYTLSFQGEFAFSSNREAWGIGLKAEIISGDKNKDDDTLTTFDALYPRGAYFGRVAKFGPSNLMDLHPYIQFKKARFYYELDYDVFWRHSISDGVYGASLQLDFPSTNEKFFIAQQLGTLIGYDVNTHLNLELETNTIFPGDFLKERNLTKTLFHAVLTSEFKF